MGGVGEELVIGKWIEFLDIWHVFLKKF